MDNSKPKQPISKQLEKLKKENPNDKGINGTETKKELNTKVSENKTRPMFIYDESENKNSFYNADSFDQIDLSIGGPSVNYTKKQKQKELINIVLKLYKEKYKVDIDLTGFSFEEIIAFAREHDLKIDYEKYSGQKVKITKPSDDEDFPLPEEFKETLPVGKDSKTKVKDGFSSSDGKIPVKKNTHIEDERKYQTNIEEQLVRKQIKRNPLEQQTVNTFTRDQIQEEKLSKYQNNFKDNSNSIINRAEEKAQKFRKK